LARFSIREIGIKHPAECKEWTEFVSGEKEISALYFYPQFLKIIADLFEKIRLYSVSDKSSNERVGGFVIKERRRYGLTIGETPTFCMSNFYAFGGNLVFDQQWKTESYFRDLFYEIADFLIKKYDKMSLISDNSLYDIRPFQWRGFQDSTLYNYQTEVYKDVLELKRYRSSTRRQIKKCTRDGLVVRTEVSPGLFYDLWYSTNVIKGRKAAFSKRQIVDFIQVLQKIGLGETYGVYDKIGNLHAAALVCKDDKTGYYLMGGSDFKLRKSGAASLLHHEIMTDLKNRGFKYYDWFGGNNPEIVRFKIGFNPILKKMTKLVYYSRRALFFEWIKEGKKIILKK
jgi:hypothetical protein